MSMGVGGGPGPSAGWEWGPRWLVGCRGVSSAAYSGGLPTRLVEMLWWLQEGSVAPPAGSWAHQPPAEPEGSAEGRRPAT